MEKRRKHKSTCINTKPKITSIYKLKQRKPKSAGKLLTSSSKFWEQLSKPESSFQDISSDTAAVWEKAKETFMINHEVEK